MEEQERNTERRGLTRRDALKKGAVIGGALVWAAPAVQTLAKPAFGAALHEGSPQGNTYSFVAVLFNCGGTYYRVKVGADDTVEFGPSWQNDGCVFSFFRDCAGIPNALPPGFSFTRDADGSVHVSADCTVAFVDFHNGQCCVNNVLAGEGPCPPASNGGGDTYCQADTPGHYSGIGTGTANFPGPAPNGNTLPCCP